MTADLNTLTDRQRDIYEFIRDQIAGVGRPPTVRDIGRAFGIRSPNGVVTHLKALERKGFIERDAGEACGIRVLESDDLAELFDLCRRVRPESREFAATALRLFVPQEEGRS